MAKGRPNKYSEELVDKICSLIMQGNSLLNICKADDMPCVRTVHDWLSKKEYEDFLHKYTRAREIQADYLFDEILAISDDSSKDMIIDKEGNQKLNQEHVQRSRLRVDSRKWMASKLAPKKYGDKLELDNKHSGGITIEVVKFGATENE